MTRYPNPFAAFSEWMVKAFAILADRDNVGGRSAFVVMPRSRARHVPTPQAPPATAPSTPHSAEHSARPIEKSESVRRRRHTDPR
jgi:hypothetical protein